MADNYLNKTVLRYWYNRLKTAFAKQTDLDALDTKVDGIIAEGGEPNVIETVKVNGAAVTPDAQKAVDVAVPTVTMSGYQHMTVTPAGENSGFNFVQNANGMMVTTESGSTQLANTGYVDANGGKIDTISVNGTQQTITNKNVDITVPTKISDLTNDSNFQNDTQVQDLIDDALADITGIDFQVVQTLPQTGVKGTIYLVTNSGTSPNIYDEYIYTNNAWEKIGTTEVDLSNYWNMTNLTAITTAEIDEIMGS